MDPLDFLLNLVGRAIEIERGSVVGNLNLVAQAIVGAAVLTGGGLLFDLLRLLLWAMERGGEYRSARAAGKVFRAKEPPKSDSPVKPLLILAATVIACPLSLAAMGY